MKNIFKLGVQKKEHTALINFAKLMSTHKFINQKPPKNAAILASYPIFLPKLALQVFL